MLAGPWTLLGRCLREGGVQQQGRSPRSFDSAGWPQDDLSPQAGPAARGCCPGPCPGLLGPLWEVLAGTGTELCRAMEAQGCRGLGASGKHWGNSALGQLQAGGWWRARPGCAGGRCIPTSPWARTGDNFGLACGRLVTTLNTCHRGHRLCCYPRHGWSPRHSKAGDMPRVTPQRWGKAPPQCPGPGGVLSCSCPSSCPLGAQGSHRWSESRE